MSRLVGGQVREVEVALGTLTLFARLPVLFQSLVHFQRLGPRSRMFQRNVVAGEINRQGRGGGQRHGTRGRRHRVGSQKRQLVVAFVVAEMFIVVVFVIAEMFIVVEIVAGWLQILIGRGRRSQRRKTRQKPTGVCGRAHRQCTRSNKGRHLRLDVGKH